MTTQTPSMSQNRIGVRTLLGATVATLAVLGGSAFWQTRPGSEATHRT